MSPTVEPITQTDWNIMADRTSRNRAELKIRRTPTVSQLRSIQTHPDVYSAVYKSGMLQIHFKGTKSWTDVQQQLKPIVDMLL